ncbi:uncharacterized protein LOC116307716 [Actinia tenebrosa]|uniref:Uncharacterized protein LOC116307716 n=1 Tax=Actinia tenebrosa TaxID=6105 RepID=A0A6P8J2V2_ACTTE|nr:uncharacterized protein LOC116307716 [Actinia tenebrosa]
MKSMRISLIFATLFTLGVFNSVLALKCYQWTEDEDPTKGKARTCKPEASEYQSCVLIGLAGFNRITRQKLTLTQGMCDNGVCNATRLCNIALKTIRNFDTTKCNAKCCDSDMCNAIPFSTTPTEGMQTIPIPRVARSTRRVYRTIGDPMTTDDEVEEYDFTPATGINCFYCQEGSDLDSCHLLPSVARCGMEYDSCVTITGTLADNKSIEVAYRGCGLAEINCNIKQHCIDVENKLFVNEGKQMATCNGYCCRSNFCNNFNPTRPVEVSSRLKTTKTRRTAPAKKTTPSESTPIKCYECRPEVFGAMCRKNATARTCETGYDEYDSCLTMTASITNATTNKEIDTGEWMDCAVRDMDCNATSSRCDKLSDILKSKGLGLKNCLVNCCQGDLCNNFAPTASPKISAQAISQAQVPLVGNMSILMALFSIKFFAWKLMS